MTEHEDVQETEAMPCDGSREPPGQVLCQRRPARGEGLGSGGGGQARSDSHLPCELPVRAPGRSALPPTSPRMLGKTPKPEPADGAEATGRSRNRLVDLLHEFRLAMGQAVTARRSRLGLTQGELAALAGCDRQTISRLENAHSSPTLDQWLKVATALRMPLSSLLRSAERQGEPGSPAVQSKAAALFAKPKRKQATRQ
jgi:transcriptional regulator with XRE-family HTH domain